MSIIKTSAGRVRRASRTTRDCMAVPRTLPEAVVRVHQAHGVRDGAVSGSARRSLLTH